MAQALKETNEARKDVERKTYEKAKEVIQRDGLSFLCPLVVYVPDAHEGVIGIVAGSLCEEYCVPTLVFTNIKDKSGNTLYKGSARTCGTYHIKNEFDKNASFFIKYGGHAEAAGMTIRSEDFLPLTKALQFDPDTLSLPDPNVLYYDLEITPEDVEETIRLMKSFEPFGEGNPEPVVRLNSFTPCIKYGNYRRILGEAQTTIKLNSEHLEALGFHMVDRFESVDEKSRLDIVGRLLENVYKGTVTPQINIKDFAVAK